MGALILLGVVTALVVVAIATRQLDKTISRSFDFDPRSVGENDQRLIDIVSERGSELPYSNFG